MFSSVSPAGWVLARCLHVHTRLVFGVVLVCTVHSPGPCLLPRTLQPPVLLAGQPSAPPVRPCILPRDQQKGLR